MEQEGRKNTHAETTETGKKMTDIIVVDLDSYTDNEIDVEKNKEVGPGILEITRGLAFFFIFYCSLVKYIR